MYCITHRIPEYIEDFDPCESAWTRLIDWHEWLVDSETDYIYDFEYSRAFGTSAEWRKR